LISVEHTVDITAKMQPTTGANPKRLSAFAALIKRRP
jgi:hypothetical protein